MSDRARELLERCRVYFYHTGLMQDLGEEIRAYLAEPEVESKPIAYWDTQEGKLIPAVPLSSERTCFKVTLVPLYIHPAPRPEFVRLSGEEIRTWNIVGHESLLDFVRAIEDALEEKNK